MSQNINENLILTGSKFIKQKEFWRNRLTDDVRSTKLLAGDEGNTGSSEGTANQETVIPIPDSLCRGIVKLGKESDMSIYIILLAGLKALIYHYTGSEDITVISPVYMEFVTHDTMNNSVFIRNRLDNAATFRDLLLKLKQTVLDAYDNQDYPCTRLLESLYGGNIPREQLSGNLTNVICLLTNLHDAGVAVGEKDKIVFVFTREGESIVGHIAYNPCLYDNRYLDRISKHFIRILEIATLDINEKISQISFLSNREKDQLLYDFNGAELEYPRDMTIHQLFEQQVGKKPDCIALIHDDLENGLCISISYGELNRRADCLARTLRDKGIGRDSLVGIMVEPSIEMLTGIFGVLKAGGAYLPIDPDLPESRIIFFLNDSRSELLLVNNDLPVPASFSGEVINLSDHAIYSLLNEENPGNVNAPGDLMYIIYTSGSTGKPKGVLIEHRNVVAYVYTFYREFELSKADTVIQQASFSFDAFVEEVYPILLWGGRLAIPEKYTIIDMALLSDFVFKHNVSLISCSPLLLNELNSLGTVDSIRTFISGGDVLRGEFADRLLGAGNVYNTYGPTETTVCSTYFKIVKAYEGNIPIGKPIHNYKVYILDKHERLLPIGVPGEMCIAGEGVARGYLNKPELTAEKFIHSPLFSSTSLPSHPSTTMYHTGDLARWLPDGNIEFLGRIDQQVKIRGYRIELEEIASHFLNHDRIKEAVIIDGEDQEGDKYICAYYVVHTDISVAELREYLAFHLPAYMVPSYFVQLDHMPLTVSGKIDRKALPRPSASSGGVVYSPPRDRLEEELVKIWAAVLGVQISRLGIDDNFFELGGHSLKATILASEIHKEFNVKVPLKKIFDTPTVREFGRYINTTVKDRFISIESAEKKNYYELSSAQKRIYVQQQMVLDSVVYNMPQVLVLEGELDKDKLENTFRELIKRHDSLRTSFEIVDKGPVQKIHPHVDFKIDFFVSNPQQHKDFINKFVQPFDLSTPPLLRVQLLREDKTKHVLMMDMHHIITDGVSMELFVREFIAVYSGEELPPLKLQYKDYSEWRLTQHTMNSIAGQRDYWLSYFAGGVPKLKLVPDFPQYNFSNFEGRRIDFVIEEELTRKLYDLAQKTGTTLFMVMLASFYVLLFRYTKQQDIVVGTAVTGRKHADLKHIIGMFVNMLALRNHPESNKPFCVFLEEVKQDVLNAFDNQDYQFGDLIIDLNLQGTSNRNPLFDVVFSMDSIDAETDNRESDEEPTQLRITPYELERKISPFDLLLLGKAHKDTVSMFLEYSTGLFQPSTAVKLIEHYREILNQVVENNEIQLREIKMSHGLVEVKADRLLQDEGDFGF